MKSWKVMNAQSRNDWQRYRAAAEANGLGHLAAKYQPKPWHGFIRIDERILKLHWALSSLGVRVDWRVRRG
jgi:hypothetical protein